MLQLYMIWESAFNAKAWYVGLDIILHSEDFQKERWKQTIIGSKT